MSRTKKVMDGKYTGNAVIPEEYEKKLKESAGRIRGGNWTFSRLSRLYLIMGVNYMDHLVAEMGEDGEIDSDTLLRVAAASMGYETDAQYQVFLDKFGFDG